MASVVAYESDLKTFSAPVGEDLSSYQYCAVKWSTGTVVKAATAGEAVCGILQNKPSVAGQMAEIAYSGVSRVKLGDTVTQGSALRAGASATIVPATGSTDFLIGHVLSDGAVGGIVPAILGFTYGYGTSIARVREKETTFSAALVKAGNTTPLVMLDHSAMITAGEISTGDVLIFQDALLQLNGGAANYDTNNNSIAKYQTAGGGATVSTTLANFFNAGADGKLGTLKQLVTDITPEANQDIVLTMSASPYTSAGDRPLTVAILYSVYTPT